MASKPTIVRKKVIDVVPYFNGIYCTIQDSKPFVNQIVTRAWSENGDKIQFMLESHNFDSHPPDEEIDVVEIDPTQLGTPDDLLVDILKRDSDKMAKRPIPTIKCPHCEGTGKLPKDRLAHG